jgi:hypothetical protein
VIAPVLIVLGCASAAANAHQRKSPLVVLHPRFHVVGSGPGGVYIDGPYVLLLTSAYGESSGTLIDEQTGTQTTVSYPGCPLLGPNADPFGGPMMLLCATQGWGEFELYDPYTGEWRAVVPDPGIINYLNNCPGGAAYCGSSVVGFGVQWIEWREYCRDCNDTFLFQNIDTGQVRSLPGWQVGGRIIPDLNSPSLAQALCPPLTLTPGGWPEYLSFYGSFAIASSPARGEVVLERCGSKLKLAIGSYNELLPEAPGDARLGASSHAIVWAPEPNSRTLDGLFLPSLRRFVIATSPSTSPRGVVLSSGELYVVDGSSGTVFATPAPTQRDRHTPTTRHN